MRHLKRILFAAALGTASALPAFAQSLSNPLGSTDIPAIIGNVIKGMLGLSGAIALLVFVWSGVLMMISGGNADRVKKAKQSLIWATIGLVVIFTAYTLVYTLISVLSTGSGQ